MHVITRKRLNEFAEKFPDIEIKIMGLYYLVTKNVTESFGGKLPLSQINKVMLEQGS